MSTAVCYARTVYLWFSCDIIARSDYFRKQQLPDIVWTVYHLAMYRVSRWECARLRQNVPYVKVHRYNPKHLSEVEQLRR